MLIDKQPLSLNLIADNRRNLLQPLVRHTHIRQTKQRIVHRMYLLPCNQPRIPIQMRHRRQMFFSRPLSRFSHRHKNRHLIAIKIQIHHLANRHTHANRLTFHTHRTTRHKSHWRKRGIAKHNSPQFSHSRIQCFLRFSRPPIHFFSPHFSRCKRPKQRPRHFLGHTDLIVSQFGCWRGHRTPAEQRTRLKLQTRQLAKCANPLRQRFNRAIHQYVWRAIGNHLTQPVIGLSQCAGHISPAHMCQRMSR